jgi:hypothetical protein
MDNITIHTTTTKIKKLYEGLSYFDQYGGSVFLFFFLTSVTFLVSGYFFMMMNSGKIKADWMNQRCNPSVIPFAGFINKPDNMSEFEYTQQNFAFCTDQILIPITLEAVNPFSYIVDAFLAIYTAMAAAINAIREVFDKIRQALAAFLNEILGRLSNFILPVIELILSMKDSMGKVIGVMTTSLYTTLGAYNALKSMLGSVLEIAIILLISIVGAVILQFVFLLIPFTAPFASIIIGILTAFYVSITVVLLVLVVFLNDTMQVHANGTIPSLPPVPMPPSCFDKNTQLKLVDGTYKAIVDIEVGEELYENGKVTSKMKLDASRMTMYNLNGVIVSGCHYVNIPKYDDWIQVKNHPESLLLESYNEPYIYCINTTTKTINIGDDIYSDWDEVLEYLYDGLFKKEDLEKFHKYLDAGLAKTTKITLRDGSIRNIKDIEVNDILLNGEKVYGVVEIDGISVSQIYWYPLLELTGGPNLNFCSLDKNDVSKIITSGKRDHNKLYHLLTDQKKFKVGKVTIEDYNSGIDLFLG